MSEMENVVFDKSVHFTLDDLKFEVAKNLIDDVTLPKLLSMIYDFDKMESVEFTDRVKNVIFNISIPLLEKMEEVLKNKVPK